MSSANKSSALTYSSSVGVGFTFNPTISISLSGDLLINNLTPGTAADSNVIDVTVATNASQGYNLLATVGVKGGTSALVNTENSNYSFTNLATTAGTAATLNNFSDNTWGYSYSINNGTNWISGDAGNAASGYAGLPLDNNDNSEERGNGGVALISTTNPADGKTIKFKIGAKASNAQAAGTYTNTINFYAVTNADPITFDIVMQRAGKAKLNGYYKIQDVTPGICDAVEQNQIGQVIDSRDQEVYYITKLNNGKCWMMDNLRLGGSSSIALSPSDTNIATNYILPVSTTSTFNSYSEAKLNATYENDIAPVTYGSGSGKVGVYYNYCAATAGTFCYDEDNNQDCTYGMSCYDRDHANTIYDICPIGWKLPTAYNGGDYSGTSRERISTPLSGTYSTTQNNLGLRGTFWSSNHAPNENYGLRAVLLVASNGYDYRESSFSRTGGASIRCLLSE